MALVLWLRKRSLGGLAIETGLPITVSHFPPGTSKFNIGHRLFSHFRMNRRGRPLTGHAVVVEFMGATTTTAGSPSRANLIPPPRRWA